MWPEMARVIGEFESLVETSWKTENLGQHEQTKHTQKAFLRDFQSLRDVIEEKANSFSDSSGDLLNLDSHTATHRADSHTATHRAHGKKNNWDRTSMTRS